MSITESSSLLSSSRFRTAKKELLQSILDSSAKIRCIRAPHASSELRERYLQSLQEFSRDRGRELYFPFLASGLGSGPFVELEDGSVKYDMITGIGIGLFGHTHPELIGEMIDALPADVMQGNLEPGHEAKEL